MRLDDFIKLLREKLDQVLEKNAVSPEVRRGLIHQLEDPANFEETCAEIVLEAAEELNLGDDRIGQAKLARLMYRLAETFKGEPHETKVKERAVQIMREALERSTEEYNATLAKHLKDNPSWLKKALVGSLQVVFSSLKQHIENPEEPGVSWNSPTVTMKVPAEWNAKELRPQLPGLRPQDLETPEAIERRLGEFLYDAQNLLALSHATSYLFMELDGELCTGIGTFSFAPFASDFDKLGKEERLQRTLKLAEPYIKGEAYDAGITAEPPEECRPGEQTGVANLRTLRLPLEFEDEETGTVKHGEAFVILHPLVVQKSMGEAFYPLRAGLNLPELPVWTPEDQAQLWALLGVALDKLKSSDRAQKDEKGTLFPIAPKGEAEAVEVATRRYHTATVAFGDSLISKNALAVTQSAHKIKLPSKWSSLPILAVEKKKEVQRLQAEKGQEAFEDLRKKTGDKDESEPLLKKVRRVSGEEIVLTAEGERRLKKRLLDRGYVDTDENGEERLYKCFEVGKGLLEIGLSWHGLAGPLVDEWRTEKTRAVNELKKRRTGEQMSLFHHLEDEERRRIDNILNRLHLYEDGRKVMEMILGQVGRQRTNPVSIPGEAFCVLLWPDRARDRTWPPNWRAHVEGILTALNKLTFSYRGNNIGASAKGYGSFLGEWNRVPDGDTYILDVQSGFLGCLTVFESDKTQLRGGMEAITYRFDKTLSTEEKRALGWGVKGENATDHYIRTDAGSPFYDTASGFTPPQSNLRVFLENNITKNRDALRTEHNATRLRKGSPDAEFPRPYNSMFCPLIPNGERYMAALGHFDKSPEIGWRLIGTGSKKSRHIEGLLSRMGYTLPPGRARDKRGDIIGQAVKDMETVMKEFHGFMAVLNPQNHTWMRLEEIRNLPASTLQRLRLFPFIHEDYTNRRRARWQEVTGRFVTEDVEEASRDARGDLDEGPLPHKVITAKDGYRGLPLRERLLAVMKERMLEQKDVASLFGVGKATISLWLSGKREIPQERRPLFIRWVEGGDSPSPEELEELVQKRPGRR